MRRTKEWWSGLDKQERSLLVGIEKADARYGIGQDPYLPDGYGECNFCGNPTSSNICDFDNNRRIELIEKANSFVEKAESE